MMSALRAASRARSATLAPCVAPARAQRPRPRRAACRAAADENEGEYGANPDASLRGEHFLAVGRAHCFALDEAGKLQDKFVIEPLPAGAYEAMTCGSKVRAAARGKIVRVCQSLLGRFQRGARLPAAAACARHSDAPIAPKMNQYAPIALPRR